MFLSAFEVFASEPFLILLPCFLVVYNAVCQGPLRLFGVRPPSTNPCHKPFCLLPILAGPPIACACAYPHPGRPPWSRWLPFFVLPLPFLGTHLLTRTYRFRPAGPWLQTPNTVDSGFDPHPASTTAFSHPSCFSLRRRPPPPCAFLLTPP